MFFPGNATPSTQEVEEERIHIWLSWKHIFDGFRSQVTRPARARQKSKFKNTTPSQELVVPQKRDENSTRQAALEIMQNGSSGIRQASLLDLDTFFITNV